MTLVLMQCNGTVSNVHEVYLLTVNNNVFHRSTVMDSLVNAVGGSVRGLVH